MKKLGLICATVLACSSLAACGTQSSTKKATSSSGKTSSKVIRHHHKSKKKQNKSNNSASNNLNSQSNSSISNQQGNQQAAKSQGEINRERGYDPNGAPLLPGQDHAAGSNPDGSPDAWVQGQIDWSIQNGYMNPDGTNTPKGQAAEDEVERDSQPGMP